MKVDGLYDKYIGAIVQYFKMLYDMFFHKQTKFSVMRKLIGKEIDELMFGSLGIVSFISIFVGGVIAVQMALNIDNPLIPKSLIGFATRQTFVLEFAPTLTSIILAGKVGSFITSSIGTMRVTEQIDALDIMGVNSVNYLVLPKVIALLLYPFIIAMAMVLGIFGGYMVATYGGYCTSEEFIEGVRLNVNYFHITYSLIKSLVFALVLSTVPSYHGYYMKGGALDVGKASTNAFVWTSVIIIIIDFIITQLLLA